MDPITAITAATAAFNTIKKGFEVGREVESMYGDIGRWMTSVEAVEKEAKSAKSRGMSVEEEALEIFADQKNLTSSVAKKLRRILALHDQKQIVLLVLLPISPLWRKHLSQSTQQLGDIGHHLILAASPMQSGYQVIYDNH